MNNARMKGMGLGMSSRRFHEDEETCEEEKTVESKSGKKYTKKQICEAIAYWKKQLDKLDENKDDVESMDHKRLVELLEQIHEALEHGLQGEGEKGYEEREAILADFDLLIDRITGYDGWLDPK